MNKKLFVGNLSYATTDEQLRVMFEAIGPITSAAVITDRFSGKSKGFGFVEMESEESARAAIEALNNKELNGRNITVSEARPPAERSSGGFGGGRSGGFGGDRGGFGGDRGGRGGDRRGGGGGDRRGGGGDRGGSRY